MTVHRRRRGPRKPADELKDCLVQARVPKELQSALKDEARRRRLSVSHLIRNVLEDTVELVDNALTEVDNLVSDSVGLAQQVTRDASQIAASAAGLGDAMRGRRQPGQRSRAASAASAAAEPAPTGSAAASAAVSDLEASGAHGPLPVDPAEADPLDHVYAWNPVVLNRPAACARCACDLKRGEQGHLGLTQDTAAAPVWLCGSCLDAL